MRAVLFLAFFLSGVQANAVTEVVRLLETMLEQSKKDGAADRDGWAKFKCYCDTTTEEKTTAIADAEADVEARNAILAEKRAQNTKLSQAVAALKKAMDENQAAQDEATTIRDQESAEFETEKKDLETGISQLDRAVGILSDIGADQTKTADADSARLSGAFLSQSTNVHELSADMKEALRAASVFLDVSQRTQMSALIQAPGNYNSQSTEIVGVVKSMADTFKKNLANAIAAEAKAQASYDKLMQELEKAMQKMTSEKESKEVKIGDNSAEIATQSSEVERLEGQLERDREFLASLTSRCATKKAEFEKRNALRANEEAAVAQAVAILNSDDNFELFSRTGATSLIQTSSNSAARKDAIKTLVETARTTHSLRLAQLASMLTMKNPFNDVIASIKDVIKMLDEEGDDDQEKFDFCDKEQTANKNSIKDLTDHINNVVDQINTLELGAQKTRDAIDETKQELTDNRESQKQETETRTAAHQAFMQSLTDMQAAEKLIAKAIKVLTKYYDHLKKHNETHSYRKIANKDSGGGNLERLEGASVEELEAACAKNVECVGFNSAGWLKSSLQDSSEWYDWDGGDLYEKKYDESSGPRKYAGGAIVELQAPEDGDDPFGATSKGQGKDGNKAIEMLQFILDETKSEIDSATQDESTSQSQYEGQMQALTTSEAGLEEDLAGYKKDLATTNLQLEEANEDRRTSEKSKASVQKYDDDIRPGCTFMQKNIEERKANRATEKGALEGVITTLEGTPAFQNAKAAAERKALGRCADTCEENGIGHAKCEACKNDVTVAGWCVQNGSEPGCS